MENLGSIGPNGAELWLGKVTFETGPGGSELEG